MHAGMDVISSRRPGSRGARSATLALLALACLALAACGGGSSSKNKGGASAASSPATGAAGEATKTGTQSTRTGTQSSAAAALYAKLRTCMAQQGITIPAKPATPTGPPGAGALGIEGGPRLPAGVSRARYDAALKKCGAASFGGHGLASGRFNSPASRAALKAYAACLRANGIKVPANAIGNGVAFSAKGIDTHTAQFRKAEAKCNGLLAEAFRAVPGTGPPGTEEGSAGPLGAVPRPKTKTSG